MPLLRELQTASGWRLEVKHNARMRSLYLGAIRRCSVVTVSAAIQANGSQTTRLNRFGRVLFPTFSRTAIGVFRFLDEGQPMLLHVHPRDDVPLSCEVSLGAHVGGQLWTSGLLDGYGAHLRPSRVSVGRGPAVRRHHLTARRGCLQCIQASLPDSLDGRALRGGFFFDGGVEQHNTGGCPPAGGNRIPTLTDTR